LAEAFGGTLFMDEIGDTPATIQPMLLRAIETGEYRPLGANRVERADARFIAATDRDLAAGHFNQPLLRRLEAFVIRLPPLRARREDVGVLTRHFLALAVGEGAPNVELEAADVARLARFDWPGNVRQLAHVVRRLALARQNDPNAPLDDILDTLTQAAPITSSARAREALAPTRDERDTSASTRDGAPETPARRYRDPNTIDDDALFDALAATAWCVRDAAQHLNISRTSCYALLARSRRVRRIDEIATDEIRAVMRAHPGDPDRWAATLHTPLEALKRRIRSIEREA
jgi:two-component system nitrogen regulation response regulator GlnG